MAVLYQLIVPGVDGIRGSETDEATAGRESGDSVSPPRQAGGASGGGA
jgi:hypothetical protein